MDLDWAIPAGYSPPYGIRVLKLTSAREIANEENMEPSFRLVSQPVTDLAYKSW